MAERIIDACCLINLYASGEEASIFQASGEFYVPHEVRGEALRIRRVDDDDPTRLVSREIDLETAVAAGQIQTCQLEGEDEVAFVRFAMQLDDGEASCLAIANGQYRVKQSHEPRPSQSPCRNRKQLRFCLTHFVGELHMLSGRSFQAGGRSVCAKLLAVLLGLCCFLCGVGRIKAQPFAESKLSNWHQWRGPEANGVSRTATPPIEWSEEKNVKWKIAIDGNGSSTPIIWDNKVFLLTAINTGKVDPSLPKPEDQPERVFGIKYPNTVYEFVVLCLDRDSGKELWRRTARRRIPHEGHHGHNDFASASPTTDGQRLYCWFGSAGLFCYGLDGEKLWDRDLGKVFMQASLGEGCSPVVHDGKLVVVRDHGRQSTIEVLDAKTGAARWKADRDEPNAWATPVIVRHRGRTQVVTAASNMVRSYDVNDGRIIWQCGGLTGNVIPSPVVDGDVVYCMSGYQGYALLALPLWATGDISNSDAILWTKRRGTPYIPSPLLYNGMLYFSQSNQAVLSCVDSKTGEVIIDRTRLSGISNIYASAVGADQRVYITGRNGTTLVLERSKELKVLARNTLDDQFDASAALAGNQLFLRGGKFLYCIQ